MIRKYRLELWIGIALLTLFALPFVGPAEDFYAGKAREIGRVPTPAPQQQSRVEHVSLPEDGVDNPIDAR